MKSPWNLLSKFTSRRKTPQDGAVVIESQTAVDVTEARKIATAEAFPAVLDQNVSEAKNVMDLQSSTPTLPFDAQPAPLVILSVISDEALNDDGSDDIHLGLSAEVAGRDSEPKAAAKTKDSALAKRSKKTGAKLLSQDGLAKNVHEGVSAAPSTMPSPVEEAAIVDGEIKRLRTQLAHKLVLQNAQLKKMLERFDRS